jgi:arylsulfatase A-like enzyme
MRSLLAILLFSVGLHASPPNIIVIFTDDQGYADLHCQGIDPAVLTPNIDSLAKSGVRFTSGFVTAPQCEPSRAAILSGIYQQKVGVDNNLAGTMKPGIPTIATRLRDAGYHTVTVGKWGVGGTPLWKDILSKKVPAIRPAEAPLQPAARGFDSYFSGVETLYLTNRDRRGIAIEPTIIKDEDYRLEVQNKAAAALLDSALGRDKPVFLYFAPYAPHLPLTAPEKYEARFPDVDDKTRRTCLAMISCIDDGVGEILATLKKHEALENTLIFFISDNGAPNNNGGSNNPLQGSKGSLLDGGTRVPYIVSWPAAIAGNTNSDAMVSSLDVLPTSLAAAGVEIPTGLDGHSILPLLKGETQTSPHSELYFSWSGQSAIRTKDWKLIRGKSGKDSLYSVKTPDGEKHDVISVNPETAKDLATKLDAYLATIPKILQPPMGRKAKSQK